MVTPNTPCHQWTGRISSDGYAWSGALPAYRKVWQEVHGPIAPGMELDHLCRNRGCVNPDHLELVTHAENMRRSRLLVGRTTCRAGHDLTVVGVYVYPDGRQNCRECKRRHSRESKARVAARTVIA